MKIVEFAKNEDPNEAAHNEPPHPVYTVCPLIFQFPQYDIIWRKLF